MKLRGLLFFWRQMMQDLLPVQQFQPMADSFWSNGNITLGGNRDWVYSHPYVGVSSPIDSWHSPNATFTIKCHKFQHRYHSGLGLDFKNKIISQLRTVPPMVYVFGTVGLFGYHFLYFSALRMAPAAEASLIAYLWPLFIVLFSGFLPNEHLHRNHIFGACLAFAGAAALILQGDTSFSAGASTGYLLAFLCALTWSGYSVISRKIGYIPTTSVAIFCAISAICSTAAHLMFEETYWPTSHFAWFSLVLLGIGPVGMAFYTWDIGMKRGNIQLLGTASYAAPLLSTLILVVSSYAEPSRILFLSAALIAGGALLAARTAHAS